MNIDLLTQFFGWCSLIGLVLLIVTTTLLTTFIESLAGWHSRLFGASKADVKDSYFNYLGNLKLLLIVLFWIPYLALSLIG